MKRFSRLTRSTPLLRRTAVKRSRIKRKPRKPSETLRIYGTPARRAFVKSLPCAACGVVGHSQNAHLTPKGEKGTGYKGGFRFIAPLCGFHISAESKMTTTYYVGCHHLFDEQRYAFDLAFPHFDPEKAAADTEAAWVASQRGEGT